MPVAPGTPSSVQFSTPPSATCDLSTNSGRIQGRGLTNKYTLDDGNPNAVQVTLYNADTGLVVDGAFGPALGLSFDFANLVDGWYFVRLEDSDGAARDSDPVEIDCAVTPCDLAFDADQPTSAANTNPAATLAPGSAGYGLGTGLVTVRATSGAAGPIQYALDLGGTPTYYAPAVLGDVINLGLTDPALAPLRGLPAGTYGVLAKDSAGCAIRTTVEIAEDFACAILVEVEVVEDVAYIRNLGSQVLEYDWTGGGVFTDQRFRSGMNPDDYTVRVRDKKYPACFLDVDFVVVPYPSPRLCCLTFLVVRGEWFHIDEPLRLNAQELVIKRDQKLHGVTFEYGEMALGFNCEAGFALIDAEYQAKGADAEIGFVELGRDPLAAPFMKLTYSGRLNLYECDRTDGAFNCNVEATGLATLLASRLKTNLDLLGGKNLDGAALDPVAPPLAFTKLHSKAITKVGHYASDGVFGSTGEWSGAAKTNPTVVLGFNTPVVDDLKLFNSQNSGFSETRQTYPFFEAAEAGDVRLEYRIRAYIAAQLNSGGPSLRATLDLYFQKNQDPPVNIYHYQATATQAKRFSTDDSNGGLGLDLSDTRSLSVAVGDQLFLYGSIQLDQLGAGFQSWDFQVLLDAVSFVKIIAETEAPASAAEAFPIYEALDRGLEIALGRPGLLRSTYFGRPNSSPRSYAALGEGGRYVLASGFMLRGVGQKPFAPSIQDIFDGVQPIFNVGAVVETDAAGLDSVRVERAEDFYENRLALRLDTCDKFSRKIDATRSWNLVNIGYDKWQPEGKVENALDEPNARRQYATPIRNNAAEYKQYSKFIAGEYLLEAQRRIGASGDDGKNDNDTFIVAVLPGRIEADTLGDGAAGASLIVVEGHYRFLKAGATVEVLSGQNAGAYTVRSVQFSHQNKPSPAPGADVLCTLIETVQALATSQFPDGVRVFLGEQLQAEKTEGFVQVENLYSPASAYNLRITPGRMLRRHALFLNGATWFKGGAETYRPTFAEGNQALITRLVGEAQPLVEAAEISRQDLAPLDQSLFIPEILSFESYLDQPGFDQLRALRHGYIAVNDGVDWYTGFILSAKWLREKNKGTFQLLRRAGDFNPEDDVVTLREFNPSEFNQPEFN